MVVAFLTCSEAGSPKAHGGRLTLFVYSGGHHILHIGLSSQRLVGHPTHVISICRAANGLSNHVMFVEIGLFFVQ